MTRSAFSLLEIIIATAVLAASAMVLSSLIGLGSRYGNRAEERTLALAQAQSLLDEFLAQASSENNQAEVTGELPGSPPRKFRIRSTPFDLGGASRTQSSGESFPEKSTGLWRITVEMYETGGATAGHETEPLVQLFRLFRRPAESINGPLASDMDRLEPSMREADANRFPGGFP